MIRILNGYPPLHYKRTIALSVVVLCVLLTTVMSFTVGVESIDWREIFYSNSKEGELLFISRIPRTVTLILTGAGLSISGVIMQHLAQNKFISPTTAGALDASKLGILCGLLFFSEGYLLVKLLFAVLFCFGLTSIFTFSISHLVKRNTILIPVFGIMYGYTLNALTNMIGVQFNIIQNMEGWMVGNFAKSIKGQYEIIYILVPLFMLCYFYAYKFTIAGLGRDFTMNVGVNYRLIINIGLMLTAVMVSTTMLAVGSIPFIDLVIPNIVSIVHGDNIRRNLPFTACYGAITLLLCDLVGRVVIFPYEMPSSMIVGSLGALVFLIMLIKKGR